MPVVLHQNTTHKILQYFYNKSLTETFAKNKNSATAGLVNSKCGKRSSLSATTKTISGRRRGAFTEGSSQAQPASLSSDLSWLRYLFPITLPRCTRNLNYCSTLVLATHITSDWVKRDLVTRNTVEITQDAYRAIVKRSLVSNDVRVIYSIKGYRLHYHKALLPCSNQSLFAWASWSTAPSMSLK